jgi:class 3 adenylate cyclase
MTIIQPEPTTTNRATINGRQNGNSKSMRFSTQAQILEKMLLRKVSDRNALYKSITRNNQTQGLAVILILRVRPKVLTSSQTVQTIGTTSTFNSHESKRLDPIEELHIIQRVRQLFEEDDVLLDHQFSVVKYDDHRIFILCDDPVIAMERMLRARKIVNDEFASSQTASITIRGGCESGGIFELQGDYFGAPVNTASKLGDDTAEPNELLVSFDGDEARCIKKMKHRATFELGRVEVSGVVIDFYYMEEKEPRQSPFSKLLSCCIPNDRSRGSLNVEKQEPDGGGKDDSNNITTRSSQIVKEPCEKHPESCETLGAEWKELIMLQSDLSGFTRLTKKYGILHFMTLIMNCRKIFEHQLNACDGEVLKYDGDNIICRFPCSKVAISCVLEIYRDIEEYNKDKEEDFQIRCKIGMAKGIVLVSSQGDIMGDGWEDCCTLSEEMAKVGEILITEEIKNDLKGIAVDCKFEPRPETEDMAPHYNLTLS